ncbi:Tyrosyl-DNA phosphodiesterase C-terminal domain [Phytophthora cactorum]|nr:Tyrosyl-DNA phosphodiesterase C-terminal domain [Phytophthora cactorum]
MADDTRPPKRQKLATSTDADTAPPDVCFFLNRLKTASPHNLHAKSLSDLLEGKFSRCLLTNYMFDLPWLFAECPRLKEVPVLLVHGERDRHGYAAACRLSKCQLMTCLLYFVVQDDEGCREYPNVTPVAPPLPIPYGTHHTKMLVALYPEKVRVAIFTANFLSNDWNTKTQGLWYQDFGSRFLLTADLVHYLSSLGASVKLFCGELKRFDFSTARVALFRQFLEFTKAKNMKPFLHKYLRKWMPPSELHRQNAMPHIKLYARFNPSDDKAGELDWAIVTSSNLSKAAWGALQKNKTQFMIRSYELGVMFLPPLLGRQSKKPRHVLRRLGVKWLRSQTLLDPTPNQLSSCHYRTAFH